MRRGRQHVLIPENWFPSITGLLYSSGVASEVLRILVF